MFTPLTGSHCNCKLRPNNEGVEEGFGVLGAPEGEQWTEDMARQSARCFAHTCVTNVCLVVRGGVILALSALIELKTALANQ
jgi:hypothetical protein